MSIFDAYDDKTVYSIFEFERDNTERSVNNNTMGSSSSKFKKYLLHGDEYAAMQVSMLKNFFLSVIYGFS